MVSWFAALACVNVKLVCLDIVINNLVLCIIIILGPKLFILYINYLCNISRLVKYILFADDTNLFCADKNINQLVSTVSIVLDKLCI